MPQAKAAGAAGFSPDAQAGSGGCDAAPPGLLAIHPVVDLGEDVVALLELLDDGRLE